VPLAKAVVQGHDQHPRQPLPGVVDFPAFIGGGAVSIAEQSRLLLIGERFRMGSALARRPLARPAQPPRSSRWRAKRGTAPWIKAEYEDQDGEGLEGAGRSPARTAAGVSWRLLNEEMPWTLIGRILCSALMPLASAAAQAAEVGR